MDKTTVDQFVEHVSALLAEKHGVKGRSLELRVRRAGRALPREARRAAEALVAADKMSQEPKLRLRLDPDQVTEAYTTCVTHLDGFDEKAVRSQKRFSLAATLTVQMFAVAAMLIAVLKWRGFV